MGVVDATVCSVDTLKTNIWSTYYMRPSTAWQSTAISKLNRLGQQGLPGAYNPVETEVLQETRAGASNSAVGHGQGMVRGFRSEQYYTGR